MSELDEMETWFPLLAGTEYSEESPVDDRYNCIAFAFGDIAQWWWPTKADGQYWPPGFTYSADVDVLVEIFESKGYAKCEDGELEPGYEKVAIYTLHGRFKHAARQLRTGRWASKIGDFHDIEHVRAEHLNSTSYGKVSVYMRREREV